MDDVWELQAFDLYNNNQHETYTEIEREQAFRNEWKAAENNRILRGGYKVNEVALTEKQQTQSSKFTLMVANTFKDLSVQKFELMPYHQALAKHLWIKINETLIELEAKRIKNSQKQNMQPIIWENINPNKLAIDAMRRIDLGLDALIPNHIHPIPYWNSALKQYDLDLMIGYAGKNYYRQMFAIDKPLNIVYELVYSTDEFMPIKTPVGESYEFKIKNPFKRGNIIGGFGYIMYDDSRKNKLVIVTDDDFKRSESSSKSNTFWRDFPTNMKWKTVVNRTTDKLAIDPRKVTQSFVEVEKEESIDIMEGESKVLYNNEASTVVHDDINPITSGTTVVKDTDKLLITPTNAKASDASNFSEKQQEKKDTVSEGSNEENDPYPNLSIRYGELDFFCFQHSDPWLKNEAGEKYHQIDGGICKYSDLIKFVTEDICKKAKITNKQLAERVKKDYDGKIWSQLQDKEKKDLLEKILMEMKKNG